MVCVVLQVFFLIHLHQKDDLQLLGQNNVPEEWTDAVGVEGDLVNNTPSYIKLGNGIDSVDDIVTKTICRSKFRSCHLGGGRKKRNFKFHITGFFCGTAKSCESSR